MKRLTDVEIRRHAKKKKRKQRARKNFGAPIRFTRAPTARLHSPAGVISCFFFLKRCREVSTATVAKRFKAAEDEHDYDRIVLPNKEKKDSKLYLTKEQIDETFETIQIAASNRFRVKYISADAILSDNPPLPSTEDTDIIIIPIPLDLNGQINLAVFNLLTSTTWVFCRYYRQSMLSFNGIKNVLEQNYNIHFILKPKKSCDKLINSLPNSHNDAILVFRTAEELFFTGSVKKFENFDLDAERKRYSEIYDMIHTDDWDGVWPLTLQSENREIIDPEENEEENDDTRTNGTSVTSSSSDIQVVESFENGGGANTSNNTINAARSSISDFYDFDDVQPPLLPIPDLSIPVSFPSDETQSSAPLSSCSNNVVNNQLNTSVLPSRDPSNSTESDSTVFSSDIHLSTFNDGSINVNSEIDVELLPVNDVFSSTASTQILSSADTDSNNADDEMDTSESPSDTVETIGSGLDCSISSYCTRENPSPLSSFDFRNIFIQRDWRNALSPGEDQDEISSLSSGESSGESEHAEEVNVGLSPRYYNDANDSSNEKKDINMNYEIPLILKCSSISRNFKPYWGAVRKLAQDRQCIYKKLKKQLSKKRAFTDDQIIHINATIGLLEEILNSYVPIVPKWKATYQKDSDKKIIIRKGYIYERIGETNEFRCVYKKNNALDHCISFIVIDELDTIIEGSFCYHDHPGMEEYTEDEAPPLGTSMIFCRAKENREKHGKYVKLIAFLDETLNEVVQWRRHIAICLENLKLIHEYLNDLENVDFTAVTKDSRNLYKNVIMETKNLLRCIRLDK